MTLQPGHRVEVGTHRPWWPLAMVDQESCRLAGRSREAHVSPRSSA